MFEILTLAQTEKLSKKIDVILYGREYWERILHFEPMIEAGAISPQDMDLFRFADTPQQAFELPADAPDRELPEAAGPRGGQGARAREDAGVSGATTRLRRPTS